MSTNDENYPGDIRSAWDLIGWDAGTIQIVGGRATYEAVIFNCHTRGERVKLARLEARERGIAEISRYVDPETKLRIVSRNEPPKCELTKEDNDWKECGAPAQYYHRTGRVYLCRECAIVHPSWDKFGKIQAINTKTNNQ